MPKVMNFAIAVWCTTVLAGCSSTTRDERPAPSTPTPTTTTSTSGPRPVEVVKVSGHPTSVVPNRLTVHGRRLDTVLDCGPKGEVHGIADSSDSAGWPTLRQAARAWMRDSPDSRVVVLMLTGNSALFLNLNANDDLISRTNFTHSDGRWFPDESTSCAK